MRSIKAYALMQPIMNLFNATTITAALYFGGLLSAEGSIAIGSLVAFLMNIQDFIRHYERFWKNISNFKIL